MLKFSGSSCVTETQEMSVSSYRDGVPRLLKSVGTGPLHRLPAPREGRELMILGRVVNARKPDTPPRTNRSVKRRRDESLTWRHEPAIKEPARAADSTATGE